MQEKVEQWLNRWVSKPTSWTLFGVWIALKFTWFGIVWLAIWLHDKWTAWWSKNAPHADSCEAPDAPISPVPRRKRQAA